jgi:hypothetical protein
MRNRPPFAVIIFTTLQHLIMHDTCVTMCSVSPRRYGTRKCISYPVATSLSQLILNNISSIALRAQSIDVQNTEFVMVYANPPAGSPSAGLNMGPHMMHTPYSTPSFITIWVASFGLPILACTFGD